MFWKHPFKIIATITFINSKRTYFYFRINSPKRNIANPKPNFLRECRSEITYSPPNPYPIFFCLERKGWPRSELVSTTNVRYNSLLWMCMLNPLLHFAIRLFFRLINQLSRCRISRYNQSPTTGLTKACSVLSCLWDVVYKRRLAT